MKQGLGWQLGNGSVVGWWLLGLLQRRHTLLWPGRGMGLQLHDVHHLVLLKETRWAF